jgi:hypothetical protein
MAISNQRYTRLLLHTTKDINERELCVNAHEEEKTTLFRCCSSNVVYAITSVSCVSMALLSSLSSTTDQQRMEENTRRND